MSSHKPVYVKHQSFNQTFSSINASVDEQRTRALLLIDNHQAACKELPNSGTQVLEAAQDDLLGKAQEDALCFRITPFIADEMSLIADQDILPYLYHRYRYDLYPSRRILDDYPPYIQIEPTSRCNFRCVFCYQTDTSFSSGKTGFMGTMHLDLFKNLVDQLAGNVAFGSLASRGEPLLARDIESMLTYCHGKFLNMKMNTNASLLTERHAHAILSGGLQTLVFSADAAEESVYNKFRVNGSLEKVLRNVEMFQKIRQTHYPDAKIITRVSGVMFDSAAQDMDEMVKRWGGLVDQVAFVKYNPWENVYEAPEAGVSAPCSDLWRRMFVWYDGVVNPCDTDYKSTLTIGNAKTRDISLLWRSKAYDALRQRHLDGGRGRIEPCLCCTVL